MKTNTVALTISVPSELLAALHYLRQNQSVNMSAFCTRAIYAALESEAPQNQAVSKDAQETAALTPNRPHVLFDFMNTPRFVEVE
jgi:post-segregation antitoxin (ccd killing protein)